MEKIVSSRYTRVVQVYAVAALALLSILLCTATARAQCNPEWAQGLFQWQGLSAGVKALTVFDDGSGPALYAGGWFTVAGGVSADHIAKVGRDAVVRTWQRHEQ